MDTVVHPILFQGPCCTSGCTLRNGDKCRDDNGCRDASFCNGRSPQCPPSINKPNKTICNEEFVCYMGVSIHVSLSPLSSATLPGHSSPGQVPSRLFGGRLFTRAADIRAEVYENGQSICLPDSAGIEEACAVQIFMIVDVLIIGDQAEGRYTMWDMPTGTIWKLETGILNYFRY